MLRTMNDVVPVSSSACGDGSNDSGFGVAKSKEVEPSEETGQLDLSFSGDYSKFSPK